MREDEDAAVPHAVATLGRTTRILIGDAQGKGLAAIEEVGYVSNAFHRTALRRIPLPDTAVCLERSFTEDVAAAAEVPVGGDGESRNARPGPYPEGFVTAAMVDIPEDDHRIHIVNCGHPPPLLLSDADVQPLQPTEPGLPLGLGNLGEVTRHTDTARFRAGDTLPLYTDGLIEVRNPSGAFYPLEERIRAGGRARLAPTKCCRPCTTTSAPRSRTAHRRRCHHRHPADCRPRLRPRTHAELDMAGSPGPRHGSADRGFRARAGRRRTGRTPG